MNWSTINTDWDFDHGDRDQDYTVDLIQSQPQQPQGMSLDCDWAQNNCAKPASPSTWNAALASQAISTSNDCIGWGMLSSEYPANTISNVLDNPTPSLSPTYFPEHAAGCSSHTAGISPESQIVDLRRQSPEGQIVDLRRQPTEGNTCSNRVYHQSLTAKPNSRVQSTRTRTRNAQRSQDAPLSQPIKCKWDGCRYPGNFKRESLLIRHLKNIHFSPGSHPCCVPGCDAVCNRADNLTQHMRNIHC